MHHAVPTLVDAYQNETGDLPKGTEGLVAHDLERYRLVWLMADYVQTMGAEHVRARVEGFDTPPIVPGTLQDFRPDMLCEFGRGEVKRRWLLEGVTRTALRDPLLTSRWTLFSNLAAQQDIQLQFVVPRWTRSGDIAPSLHRQLEALCVGGRVWHV
jgi:hypothetical protein